MKEQTWIDILMAVPWNRLVDEFLQKPNKGAVVGEVVNDELVQYELIQNNSEEFVSLYRRLGEQTLIAIFINSFITNKIICGNYLILYKQDDPQPKVQLSKVRIGLSDRYVRYDKCTTLGYKEYISTLETHTPINLNFFKSPVEKIDFVMKYM